MFDLFKNELHRFGKVALIVFAILTGGWIYYSISTPLLQSSSMKVAALNVLVIFASLAFGLVQMGLHRRKAHWTYLLHRPVAAKSIHLALTGAGVTMLFVALILPMLTVITGYDVTTNMGVEGRHYLWPIHLFLLSLTAYFVGTYIILSPHKGAFLSFSWIILLVGSRDIVSNQVLFTMDILALVVTFTLSRLSFKVDLSSQFSDKKSILFNALVLQPGFAFIVSFSQIAYYHLPLILFDKHPDQYEASQLEGYYSQLWLLEKEDIIDQFVDNNYPQKQQLKQRIEKTETHWLATRFTPRSIKGQIEQFDKQYALTDKANQTQWVFSHQKMVLIGHHLVTDQPTGFIGAKGFLEPTADITNQDKFSSVPSVLFDQFIQTENTIYVVDFAQKELETKHQLMGNERYLSLAAQQSDRAFYMVSSNKSLYLFNVGNFEEANIYSEPSYVVNHPYPFDSSISIRYTDLIDGYLFDYRSSSLFGYKQPGFGLFYVKHDGTSNLIGSHAFEHNRPLPYWISEQDFWISPLVIGLGYTSIESYKRPSSPQDYMPTDKIFTAVYPTYIYYLCAIAALLSGLVTFLLARKIKLSASNTAMWTLLNVICALPGLLAFFFMHNWRDAFYAAEHKK
jgi:hypothetical protein